MGIIWGTTIGDGKGDTRSLDYDSSSVPSLVVLDIWLSVAGAEMTVRCRGFRVQCYIKPRGSKYLIIIDLPQTCTMITITQIPST